MGAPAIAADWQEVKILAIAIGVREAARQMGLSEEAVMKRCSREGWLAEQKRNETRINEARSVIREKNGLSANVRTAAEILSALGPDSKSKGAIALNKGLSSLADMDGEQIVERADKLSSMAKTGTVLHGWQAAPSGAGLAVVNVNLLCTAPEQFVDVAVLEQEGS